MLYQLKIVNFVAVLLVAFWPTGVWSDGGKKKK